MKAPKVSVILPVCNNAPYLAEAVDSVLSQTFGDFELLIHDDGSSDDTPAILTRYARSDGRIQISSGPNRGIVASLNSLMERARGIYLARMDGDDVCANERFEKQTAYLDSHPGCVAVGTRCVLIDEVGRPICQSDNEHDHEGIVSALLQAKGGLRGMCHPSVMMRRDAMRKLRGYSPEFRFAQDIDVFLRLSEIGDLANIPEPFLRYRLHEGAIGGSRRAEQYAYARRAVEQACLRRGMAVPSWNTEPDEAQSIADAHRKWAWWALGARNISTARVHALKAFAQEPFNAANARLIACVVRGH